MAYDIIIIGAGSSGLMASIAASAHGAKVLLLDKGDKLGRKLGISGGGRCNVTNAKELDELIKHIPGNGRYLYSSFANFDNKGIVGFFEGLGIELKEEDNGRIFPVSDKAKSVVDALVNKVRAQGVHIKTNSPVKELLFNSESVAGVRLRNGEVFHSKRVIVAVGGKSVPQTGSEGDGYAWAIQAGHSITELYPTEVPLTSNDSFIRNKDLQGLSLRSIGLSVWNPKGKKVIEHLGDMIFTHFGISGPTVLRCSQFVVKLLKQHDIASVLVTIDLFPAQTIEHLYIQTMELARNEPKKAIKNILKGLLADRIIPHILSRAGLKEDTTYDNIPKSPWMEMCRISKAFPLQINGTLSIEEAFVTGGGINLKEVDPKTMESKCKLGLYFCGEILDIHGYTGGYNITAAFSTGFTAGMSAASQID